MIGYLVDTSALWHLLRDSGLRNAWKERIGAGAHKLCEASRTEFLYSAQGPTHRDELAGLLDSIVSSLRFQNADGLGLKARSTD